MRHLFSRGVERSQDESGQVVVMTVLLFIPLFILMAIVVMDVGASFSLRRDYQGTADMAALAAVVELVEENGDPGALGEQWLLRNGFDTTNGTWTVEPIGDDRVRVTISDEYRAWFARFIGMDAWDIGATAVAQVREEPLRYSIMAMHPTKCPGFNLSGQADVLITGGGGTYTNSDCDGNALNTSGQGSLIAEDGQHDVVGGFTGTGASPDPMTGARPVLDPWRSVPAPEVNLAECVSTPALNDGDTLPPGCYTTKVDISAGKTIHLDEGVYIFRRGLRVGQGTLTSDGKEVLLYGTCRNQVPCDGDRAEDIEFTAQASADLTGHSDFENIVIWMDRTARGDSLVKLRGGSDIEIWGSVYNIAGVTDLAGGGSGTSERLNISIVSHEVVISGQGTVEMPWDPQIAPKITVPTLVE